jgi:hypothetical protein
MTALIALFRATPAHAAPDRALDHRGVFARFADRLRDLKPVPFGSKRSERKGPAQALESGAFPDRMIPSDREML